jgi:hypothetical protein
MLVRMYANRPSYLGTVVKTERGRTKRLPPLPAYSPPLESVHMVRDEPPRLELASLPQLTPLIEEALEWQFPQEASDVELLPPSRTFTPPPPVRNSPLGRTPSPFPSPPSSFIPMTPPSPPLSWASDAEPMDAEGGLRPKGPIYSRRSGFFGRHPEQILPSNRSLNR